MRVKDYHQGMTYSELLAKGYTISAAARRCGVSANHLSLVLRGERSSAKLIEALQALPVKPLEMRERLKNNVTR